MKEKYWITKEWYEYDAAVYPALLCGHCSNYYQRHLSVHSSDGNRYCMVVSGMDSILRAESAEASGSTGSHFVWQIRRNFESCSALSLCE